MKHILPLLTGVRALVSVTVLLPSLASFTSPFLPAKTVFEPLLEETKLSPKEVTTMLSPPQSQADDSKKLAALANRRGQELLSGTDNVPSQLIIHYSGYAHELNLLKAERARLENELLAIRIDSERKAAQTDDSAMLAIEALKSYTVSSFYDYLL